MSPLADGNNTDETDIKGGSDTTAVDDYTDTDYNDSVTTMAATKEANAGGFGHRPQERVADGQTERGGDAPGGAGSIA